MNASQNIIRSGDGRTAVVVDPASGLTVARLPVPQALHLAARLQATHDDIRRAVAAYRAEAAE